MRGRELSSLYINDRLRSALLQIPTHRITTVIAPMGSGKTCAINWWVERISEGRVSLLCLLFQAYDRSGVWQFDSVGMLALLDQVLLAALDAHRHRYLRVCGAAELPQKAPAPRAGDAAPRGTLCSLLTRREEEIALLAAVRRTNAEIAQALFLTENTVKNHLKRIYDKLNIVGSARNKRLLLSERLAEMTTENP